MPSNQFPSLACTCAALAALAGCTTQDLHPDVMVVSPMVDSSSPTGKGVLQIYVIRDDEFSQDASPVFRDLPPYQLMIDGRLVVWEDGTYLRAFPGSMVGFQVAAGQHALTLLDDGGAVAVTTPPFEIRDSLFTEVAVFGGPSTLRTISMLDDPSVLPAGALRLRLLNALDQHQSIELVRCPNGTANDPPSACVPAGGPLVYGALFELDSTDFADRMGWRLSAPDVVDPVVNLIPGLETPSIAGSGTGGMTGGVGGTGPRFVTSIPEHVLGPASFCPSCSYAQF